MDQFMAMITAKLFKPVFVTTPTTSHSFVYVSWGIFQSVIHSFIFRDTEQFTHLFVLFLLQKDPNDPKRWMLCTTLAESEETIVHFYISVLFVILNIENVTLSHMCIFLNLLISVRNKNEDWIE
jgi:hypothetical protein